MTVARDHGLYLTRRITEGRNASLRCSEKNYTADFGEAQSCLNIECRENRFERHRPGLEFPNQFGNLTVDAAQMTI
jgi:hypothetical protein